MTTRENTKEEFCRLIDESMKSMYQLALRLARNSTDAEDLVAELRIFLAEIGFSAERTGFLQRLPRQNAAHRRQGRSWTDYYTDELKALVRRKERMLFLLFPEYDE